jgi:hypothetical protein
MASRRECSHELPFGWNGQQTRTMLPNSSELHQVEPREPTRVRLVRAVGPTTLPLHHPRRYSGATLIGRLSVVRATRTEEVPGTSVLESKPASKPWILRSVAYVNASRWIEFVAMHEHHAKSR